MCIQCSLVSGPTLGFLEQSSRWMWAVQARPCGAGNVLPRLKAQDANVHFAASQYGRQHRPDNQSWIGTRVYPCSPPPH